MQLVRKRNWQLQDKTLERRKEVNNMEKNKKQYQKPVILKAEKYNTAHAEHCHQIKECDPYAAK